MGEIDQGEIVKTTSVLFGVYIPGITEASKSRKNQDNIDEEKRADNHDKEKQRNHDKWKTIRKRRRGLRQG